MPDQPQSLDDLLREQKRCPQCGHVNRLAAKVCANCGYRFPPESIRAEETVAVPISPAVAARQSGKPIRAKTCPDCGTVNELDAKFCPMCGHRFSTDFSKAPATTPAKPAAPGEPPFVQMPSTGTVLVNPPPPPIILPPLPKPSTTPKPPTPLPASSSAAAPSPDPDPAANADDDLDGAPAPDLTDVDLDRLRRRNRRF